MALSKIVDATYNEGAVGPNNFGAFAAAHVHKDLENYVNHGLHKCTIALNSEEFEKFKAFTGHSDMTPTGIAHHMHPVVKSASYYLREVLIKKISHLSTVMLVGTSYREMKFFEEEMPLCKFIGLVGNFTARDQKRIIDSDVAAKANPLEPTAKDFLERGKSGRFIFLKDYSWPVINCDAIVLLDSIYDIEPDFLFNYMKVSKTPIAYFTAHMVAEMFQYDLDSVKNEVFGYTWLKQKSQAIMRFDKDHSFSYFHDYKKIRFWSYNSAVSRDDLKAFWEPIHFKCGYGLFGMVLFEKPCRFQIRHFYSSTMKLLRIPDVSWFFKFGELNKEGVVYYVDKEKFDTLVRYTLSFKDNENQAQKMIDFMRSLMSPLVVGGRTLSKEWIMYDVPVIKILEYAILYTALIKKNLYAVMSNIGKLLTENKFAFGDGLIGDFKQKWKWRFARWSKKIDKLLRNRPDMLTYLESYMSFNCTYDQVSFKMMNKVVTKIATLSQMNFALSLGPMHYFDSFVKEVLAYEKNHLFFLNNASYKLSSLLSNIDVESVLHVGVEPGSMALMLSKLGMKLDLALFKNHLSFIELDKRNYSCLRNAKMTLISDIANLDINSELVISDCANSSNYEDPYNKYCMDILVNKFKRSKAKCLLIKVMHHDISCLRGLKGYKIDFLRPEFVNPMSWETYAVVKRTKKFWFSTNVDKVRLTVLSPVIENFLNCFAYEKMRTPEGLTLPVKTPLTFHFPLVDSLKPFNEFDEIGGSHLTLASLFKEHFPYEYVGPVYVFDKVNSTCYGEIFPALPLVLYMDGYKLLNWSVPCAPPISREPTKIVTFCTDSEESSCSSCSGFDSDSCDSNEDEVDLPLSLNETILTQLLSRSANETGSPDLSNYEVHSSYAGLGCELELMKELGLEGNPVDALSNYCLVYFKIFEKWFKLGNSEYFIVWQYEEDKIDFYVKAQLNVGSKIMVLLPDTERSEKTDEFIREHLKEYKLPEFGFRVEKNLIMVRPDSHEVALVSHSKDCSAIFVDNKVSGNWLSHYIKHCPTKTLLNADRQLLTRVAIKSELVKPKIVETFDINIVKKFGLDPKKLVFCRILGDDKCFFRSLATLDSKYGSQEFWAEAVDDVKRHFIPERRINLHESTKVSVAEVFRVCQKLNIGRLDLITQTYHHGNNRSYCGFLIHDENHCDVIVDSTHPYIRPNNWPNEKDLHYESVKLFPNKFSNVQNTYKNYCLLMETAFNEGDTGLSNSTTHVNARKKMVEMRNKTNFPRAVDMCIYSAVAGCGKTYFAASIAKAYKTLYVASSNACRLQYLDYVLKIHGTKERFFAKTMAASFSDNKEENFKLPNNTIELVVIDEAFRHPVSFICLIASVYPSAKILCIGDPNQMEVASDWYPDYGAYEDILSLHQLLKANGVKLQGAKNCVHNEVTSRFGPLTVRLIRSVTGKSFNLYTSNANITNISTVTKGFDLNEFEGTILTMSRESRDILAAMSLPNVMTISASQGIDRESIAVYVDRHFANAGAFKSAVYVALSRHKTNLMFYDADNNFNISNASIYKSWFRKIGKGYLHMPTLENIKEKGMDPEFFKEVASTVPFAQRPTFHQYEQMKFAKRFRDFKFDTNHAKHLCDLAHDTEFAKAVMVFKPDESLPVYSMVVKTHNFKYIRLSRLMAPGNITGKIHDQKSFQQTVDTFYGRSADAIKLQNYQKAKKPDFEKAVPKIKEKFISMYLDMSKYQTMLTQEVVDEEIVTAFNNFAAVINLNKADVKQTYASYIFELKGHLKSQIKTKSFEAAFANKGGQPVAAQEKALNIAFSVLFRVMGSLLKKCLKPNIAIADNMSDEEISKYIANWFKTVFNFEGDAPNFDATQGFLSQIIEFVIWELFCHDIYNLKFFYKTRIGSYLRTLFFNAWWSGMRPSGAVDTMIGNILVMMVIIAVLFKVEDLLSAIFKGDDSLANLRKAIVEMDTTIFDMLFKEPLKVKLSEETGEFCNYIHGFGHYVYNPILFISKIFNRNYTSVVKDEDSFLEFINGLDIMVNPIRSNFDACLKIIMSRFEFSFDQASNILLLCESFARIGYKEFHKTLSLTEFLFDDCYSMGGCGVMPKEKPIVVNSILNHMSEQCKMQNSKMKNSSKSKQEHKHPKQKHSKKPKQKKVNLESNSLELEKKLQRMSTLNTQRQSRSRQGLVGKGVVQKIMTSLACPATVDTLRWSTDYSTAPTAVSSPWERLTITNSTNLFAALFRDPVRAAVVLQPNQNYSYQGYGFGPLTANRNGSSGGKVDTTFIVQMPITTGINGFQGGAEVPLPLRFFKSLVNDVQVDQPHGEYLGTGIPSIKKDMRYVWMDADTNLTASFLWVPVSGTYMEFNIFVWKSFQEAEVLVGYESIPYGGANVDVFTAVEPGYYGFTINCNADSNTVQVSLPYVTVSDVVISTNGAVNSYGHRTLPDFEDVASVADSFRIQGASILMTNTTPELTNGGNIAMSQVPENTDFLNYTTYSIVSSLNGSCAASIKKGEYGFLKPTKPEDFDMHDSTCHDNNGLDDMFFEIYPPHSYIVCAGEPAVTETITGLYTLAYSVEYGTNSVWRDLGNSEIDAEVFEKAVSMLKGLNQFYENPSHLSSIWNWIKGAAATVIKGTIEYGPTVIKAASTLATLI